MSRADCFVSDDIRNSSKADVLKAWFYHFGGPDLQDARYSFGLPLPALHLVVSKLIANRPFDFVSFFISISNNSSMI